MTSAGTDLLDLTMIILSAIFATDATMQGVSWVTWISCSPHAGGAADFTEWLAVACLRQWTDDKE